MKAELKETKKELENSKKKCQEALTLQGEKNEMVEMIRTAFEKLIFEIQLTQKIKDILVIIMNILGYTHEHIEELFNMKQPKKKGFLNIFGK